MLDLTFGRMRDLLFVEMHDLENVSALVSVSPTVVRLAKSECVDIMSVSEC